MSRSQWTHIAAWGFLVACCLTASITTYLQVSRRLAAINATTETRREIAAQDQELQRKEQQRQAVARRLLATDNLHEDAEFLRRLRELIARSGTKALQIESVPLAPLPDILDVKPPGVAATGSNQPKDPAATSLTHLPLDVQARSTRVVLQGDFIAIRRFLGIVATYSADTMWINTNSLRLDRAGETQGLHATVVITRFIRSAPTSHGAQ